MKPNSLFAALLGALAATAGAVRAQQPTVDVALRDGSALAGASLAEPRAGVLQVTAPDGSRREVAWRDVLALHGQKIAPTRLPAFHLVGGDILRGQLVGGDAQGDSFEVQSPVLGRQRLRVDRLACIVFQPEFAEARQLQLPEGVDEAIFVKAALGFDRIGGVLHQLGDPGVRFQTGGKGDPRWLAPRELVGLRIAGGLERKTAPAAELRTRAGDRLGVKMRGLRDGRFRCELENGAEVALSLGDIAALTMLGDGVVHASALLPVEVRESSFDAEPLWPWRQDACATGGPLAAGGRTFGRGLGVHSKSRLVFAVPERATKFLATVAFDDSALRLPVRGLVDVRVLVDDKVVFEQQGMKAGDAPRSTGLLPVRPGQRLALEVDFGEGRDIGDAVDWLTPVFLLDAR